MKGNKGIGTKLYMLIAFVLLFTVGISSFSWYIFRNFNTQNKMRLTRTSKYISIVNEARKAQVDFKIQVQDWKDTLLRGNDPEAFNKYYLKFKQDHGTVESELSKLKDNMAEMKIDTSLVDNLLSTHRELYDKYTEAIKSYDKKNINSFHIVDLMVKGIDRKPTDAMSALVKQIETKAASETQIMIKQSDEDVKNFNRNLGLILAVGILLIVLFAVIISRTYKGITLFIEQLKLLMEKAEGGDLTVKGVINKRDELGDLTERFNSFIESMSNLIYETKSTSLTVASSSSEILIATDEVSKAAISVADTITNLSEDASKQAELADESRSAIKGIVEGVNNIAESTVNIMEFADEAIETVKSGTEVLKHQTSKMTNTIVASQNVNSVIAELLSKSNEIGRVVEFINGITEQINLLSLNASIEAARAGESGKGFMVVANEVKNLAELSKESTQKIDKLIAEVQMDIEKTVSEVANTKRLIEEQETSLSVTDESFRLIQNAVFKMADKIKVVAAEARDINLNTSAAEISIGNIASLAGKSAEATEEVASATQEQTASAQQVASAMNQLAELSRKLQETVAKFKVE